MDKFYKQMKAYACKTIESVLFFVKSGPEWRRIRVGIVLDKKADKAYQEKHQKLTVSYIKTTVLELSEPKRTQKKNKRILHSTVLLTIATTLLYIQNIYIYIQIYCSQL